MRLRRIVMLGFAFLMVVCCLALYLFTDSLLKPPSRGSIPEEMQDNKWLHFESRLKQLESELSENHAVVGEIKDAMQKLIPPVVGNRPQRSSSKSQVISNKIPLPTATEKPTPSNKCPVMMDNVPLTHIQMLDVYEKLKFDNPDEGPWKQGWKIEYNNQKWNRNHKLHVFIVPHSHNDPGWLKTFEEYYEAQTKSILNNALVKLMEDTRRKFIWAEISFFALWWNDIKPEQRTTVKKLIKSGQLEIVTGGWVMNDEATSHWTAIVQQLTTGHQWLRENLNITPSSGWAIDPFGHSPTQPYLLKLAGITGSLIQRTHYSVKKELALNKNLEFRWRQMWDGSGATDMWTHMMPFYSYDIPHSCGPDPKVCCQFDFKRLPGYGLTCPWKVAPQVITQNNVNIKAELLLDQWRKKAELYKTRVLLYPLGDDFRWDHPSEWDAQMKNYEKLMDYLNTNDKLHVKVQFGTLSDYFNAVRAEQSVEEFPILSGDFFTYADRDDHYWSGYYTSRPYYKRMDRVLMSYVRAGEMILALARSRQDIPDALISHEGHLNNKLQQAREALALFQHHDGVTGTSRDPVVVDYGHKLFSAISNCQHVIQQSAYHLLIQPDFFHADSDQTYFEIDDMRRGINSLPEKLTITVGAEAPSRKVVFFNSLTFSREEIVTIHVSTPYITVVDADGVAVECQVSPIFISETSVSQSKYMVNFIATVPAMGLTCYTITAVDEFAITTATKFATVRTINHSGDLRLHRAFTNPNQDQERTSEGGEFSIRAGLLGQGLVGAAFSKVGLLKAVMTKGETVPVHLDFIKYGTKPSGDKSGAYLFLPGSESIIVKNENTSPVICIIEGNILSRMEVQLPYVHHTVSVYGGNGPDSLGVEVTNVVDVSSSHNMELAMRLSTNIKNNDEFFTDLNGLQMIRRKKFNKLPLQANFYPLPSAAYIQDEKTRLTLLTSTSLGMAALTSGQVEIMQDRRLNQDDNRGVAQGVLDNHPTQHTFRILIENKSDAKCQGIPSDHPSGSLSVVAHVSSLSLLNPFIPLFYSGDGSQERAGPEEPQGTNLVASFSPMATEPGVDITIASYRDNVLTYFPNGKKKTGRGIVLHRQHLDVCYSDDRIRKYFPLGNGQLKVGELVPVSEIDEMRNSSLSFLHLGPVTDPYTMQNICPMEINTYFIYR